MGQIKKKNVYKSLLTIIVIQFEIFIIDLIN